MSWIVGVGELERLRALDPGLAGRVFDTPQTFALSAAGSPAGGFDRAVRTTSFGDENLLARAVSDGGLAQGTDAVIYDDEHWNLTPLAQQLHPSLYYHRAAEVAHRHGLLLVATPAADLVSVLAPGTPKGRKYGARSRRSRGALCRRLRHPGPGQRGGPRRLRGVRQGRRRPGARRQLDSRGARWDRNQPLGIERDRGGDASGGARDEIGRGRLLAQRRSSKPRLSQVQRPLLTGRDCIPQRTREERRLTAGREVDDHTAGSRFAPAIRH